MNKNDKRYGNIRNRLFAAIAMLLVSSIMMVSTTYAWFTLSTAPEVQGITTTVGANGNLEIALSPYTGDAEDITSTERDGTLDWVDRNLTWGNLLDLRDASYGLGDIKLMPARLYAQSDMLQPSPLYTPVYGADGRIDRLESISTIGTKLTLGEDGQIVAADNYNVNDYKGIRVIGTATSDSKYAITFNNYLSAMGIAASEAQTLAKQSLTANGAKLAEMAITHANAGESDGNDYAEYVPYMNSVIDTLKASSAKIEDALFNAVVAAGASKLSSTDKYELLMAQAEAEGATLESLMNLLALAEDQAEAIQIAYEYWQNIESDLAAAELALAAAKTKADAGQEVKFSDASAALSILLSTNGIRFNGDKTINELKEMAFLYMGEEPLRTDYTDQAEYEAAKAKYDAAIDYMMSCITNMQVKLGAGSGIYADIALMVGDLSASVELDITYPGFPALKNIPVTLSTQAGTKDGALGAARTALREEGPLSVDGQQTVSVLNDVYAYMVDFFFRTNATGSSLKLQTSAAQRIYGDSTSEATLGGGSTMSFRTGVMNSQAVQDLMGAIRVVFLDTNSNDIYGYAKLDMDTIRETVISADVSEYTADLYLYETDDNGVTLETKVDEENATLCELPANTAKAVSAMVYLSGDDVDNSMVANGVESMTGSLNLQFASSAPLVPMKNSALENMVADGTTEATDATDATEATDATDATEATDVIETP